MPTDQEIAVQVAKAYALTEILPLRHDNVQAVLRAASESLSERRVDLDLREGTLWVGAEPLTAGDSSDDFAQGLSRCGVATLRLGPRIEPRALGDLLDTVRIASISGHLENLREMVAFHSALEVVFGAPSEAPSALGQSAGAIFAGALRGPGGPRIRQAPAAGDSRPPGPSPRDGADAPTPPLAREVPEAAPEKGESGVGEPPDSTDWDPPGSGGLVGSDAAPDAAGAAPGPGTESSAAPRDAGEPSSRSRNGGGQPPLPLGEFRKGLELFLGGSPAQRRGWAGPLRAQAARVDVDADPAGTLEVLSTLLGDGSEDPDEAVQAVARELVGSEVAAALVRRLIEAGDEDERGVFLRIAVSLGGTVAGAFANELTVPEQGASQRASVHALAMLGPEALPSVEAMLDAPEWYVVRNALSVLAAIGEEDAAGLIGPRVGHPDARVRREALMALAAVGARAGGQVVVDVLDDEDPDVRATAAMVAGNLKVAAAAGCLRGRLEIEENRTVIIEVLRALGTLGDEDAIPAIRKTAEPSFFSRPSKPVRIAAYRALSRIGTPEAGAILENAADDRDPEIRAVVRQAMEALA